MSTSWTTVTVSAALAVAVSPLLASWSAALADGDTGTWWRPRRVDTARLAVVVVAALIFGALAGGGGPWPAWWLLAAGGTVLAVVDAQRNLLPAGLVYPLALLEAAVLVVTSLTTHDVTALARAGLAALIVGAGWFLLAFVAGGGVGLGDVRVATLTAALLAVARVDGRNACAARHGPAHRGHRRGGRRGSARPARPQDAGPARSRARVGKPAHELDLAAGRRSRTSGANTASRSGDRVTPAEEAGCGGGSVSS